MVKVRSIFYKFYFIRLFFILLDFDIVRLYLRFFTLFVYFLELVITYIKAQS